MKIFFTKFDFKWDANNQRVIFLESGPCKSNFWNYDNLHLKTMLARCYEYLIKIYGSLIIVTGEWDVEDQQEEIDQALGKHIQHLPKELQTNVTIIKTLHAKKLGEKPNVILIYNDSTDTEDKIHLQKLLPLNHFSVSSSLLGDLTAYDKVIFYEVMKQANLAWNIPKTHLLKKENINDTILPLLFKEIKSDFFVIKPTNASDSKGFLLAKREDLKSILFALKEQSETELMKYDYNNEENYNYWLSRNNDYYIVQECCKNTLIENFDATGRMVVIDHEIIAAYWELPQKKLEDSKNFTTATKDSDEKSLDINEHDLNDITAQSKTAIVTLNNYLQENDFHSFLEVIINTENFVVLDYIIENFNDKPIWSDVKALQILMRMNYKHPIRDNFISNQFFNYISYELSTRFTMNTIHEGLPDEFHQNILRVMRDFLSNCSNEVKRTFIGNIKKNPYDLTKLPTITSEYLLELLEKNKQLNQPDIKVKEALITNSLFNPKDFLKKMRSKITQLQTLDSNAFADVIETIKQQMQQIQKLTDETEENTDEEPELKNSN